MPNNTSKLAPEQTPAAAAVHYAAARGFCCYPQKPGTRISYFTFKTTGRKWGATSDPALLKKMFAARPDAEVCIVTGELSSVIVLDVDLPEEGKKRRDGRETLARLLAEHGPLPVTLRARTPKGGTHYFFRWPGFFVKNSVGEIGRYDPEWSSGLDIRGDGGMVVAAPSKGRAWIDPDCPVADAPQWLLDRLRADTLPLRQGKTLAAPRKTRAPAPQVARPVMDNPIVRMMIRDAGRGLENVTDADTELLKIRMALLVIPPESIDYARWYKIAAALFNVLGPALGLAHFIRWSSRDKTTCRTGDTTQPRFTREVCEHKWREIVAHPPVRGKKADVGTIVDIASEFSDGWHEAYRKQAGILW